jgi:hypothetical protein
MNNLHIITVATKNDGYYNALKQSAINNNINLITLGFGQKWTGFMLKFNLIKDYLNQLNDNDIVGFVDAYDVLILQDTNIIINKFKSFNSPIILSKDCKLNSLLSMYIIPRLFDKCGDIYINSGL